MNLVEKMLLCDAVSVRQQCQFCAEFISDIILNGGQLNDTQTMELGSALEEFHSELIEVASNVLSIRIFSLIKFISKRKSTLLRNLVLREKCLFGCRINIHLA